MLTRARMKWSASLSVLAFAALGLCACDGAPSANPARSHAGGALGPLGQANQGDGGGAQPASYGSQGQASAPRAYDGERAAAADLDADAPRYQGKPIWAANRNHSSQENADYQFKKNGADLGAGSEDDFIAKAHAFVDHPPEGAETLKRANGDVLVYDAKGNLFAVVAKDGAPRTIFKPRDGAAYWAEQKANLDKPYSGYKRSASKASGGDDNG